jgi:multidrug efflux system membrane fusion protein
MFKNLSSQAALALALATAPVAVLAAPWATEPAQAASQAGRSSYDGVVEALRQTVVAAQVPGAVVELAVKAGDTVQAGQLLLRIDARSADQSAAAVDAQVQAARAQLDVATREYERQKQLFAKKYISQAALDRAEAEVRAARAQASAQTAQAGAAHTQTGLHVVRAPYAGVVAEVPVALGDMAMPGRPLLTLYDPAQLRVTAAVPQSALPAGAKPEDVRVELAGQGTQTTPQRVQVLPTVDPATHTVQVRADLPPGLAGCPPRAVCTPVAARCAGRGVRVRASPCRKAPWCAAPSSPACTCWARAASPSCARVRLGRPKAGGWKCSAALPQAKPC